MIGSGLQGVEFIAVNTDAQVLELSHAPKRIQIGQNVTKGLGAGANPEVGRRSVEEDRELVSELLANSDMVFVTAGMGGGTGTGAAPVVAEIAREAGALTVGIVTTPFLMEGTPRMRNAQVGIDELKEHVDTLIVIPNERLLTVSSRETTLREAFRMADDVLLQATRGISDLITVPGEVNLDFNDVRTVMMEGGDALMGTGTALGEDRAKEAAEKAIKSPLLDQLSIEGAKGVLVNITAGSDLRLFEVNEAVSVVTEASGTEANVIWGTVLDDTVGDEFRVTVIATGFLQGESRRRQSTAATAAKAGTGRLGRDVPAFLRKRADEVPEAVNGNGHGTNGSNGTPEVEIETDQIAKDVSLDDLEYPTFLRRRLARK
jgi:cell division protein FtsZ